MTDANEALRALEDLVSALKALLPGAESMGWDTGNAKTAISNSAIIRAHLSDPGYVQVGHVAMCDDGSVCYEYFAQTKEGVELAIKNDGWEEMRAVPVHAATKENSND